jgi:3-hydroxybutyrate dehydrogenase
MNAPMTRPEAMPRPQLSGHVAIVTGSTGGIGLGIARTLAEAGSAVVLNGFGEPAAIEKTRAGLAEATGVAVDYHGADISEPAEVADLVASTEARHGRVDILVNNAGVQHVAPVEEFPVEKWDAILAINLSGAFHAIRAAVPGMKARRWGRIVNIASAHGLVASPFKSAYVAAKHGIIGLTKTVALETGEHGITVNAVCPGYVWTPLVERQIDEQAAAHGIPRNEVVRDVLLKKHPNKRFATVEEMGAIVAFLASDGAASITGTHISADGGWTAE